MIGQEAVKKILKAAIQKNRFSCAYLFSGPRGVGKTTAARIFSNAILCSSPVDGNPCRECESCKLFAKEQHFSYRELDAASFSGKSDMVKLRDDAAYTSISDKKIILLDESHDISTAGQDALLKQIEQCPDHLVYMFCTTNPDKMAPTLRDRCMEFQVYRLNPEPIINRLKYICEQENFKYQDDALDLITEKSEGHVRNAINLLEEVAYLEEITVDNLNFICKDCEEEIFTILINLGTDLPKVIETYRSVSSYLSAAQFYRTVLSLVNDAAKYLCGYEKYPEKRKELVSKLKDVHGYSLLEFLKYLVHRDKYVDKIGIQSDLIILHSKFFANNFVPQQQQQQTPLIDVPKIETSKNIPAEPAQSLKYADLKKLPISERSRLLREQRRNQKEEQEEDPKNVAKTWPLPNEKRPGENSLDEEILSSQEFSQNLVGGRQGAGVQPLVDSRTE